MTSPESASPSRPAKAAGFALLGVAAVALVIGVVSLFGGGGSETPPVAEGSSTAPPASGTSEQPPASTPSSAPAASTTTPPASTPSSSVVPPPPVPQPGAAKAPVRIYNNSTITGLAAKASDEVRANGWTVAGTGNYSSGNIPTTTVYFRPGTDEEASAKELAAVLRARVEPRFEGIESAAAGIILIVTNDFQGPSKNK
ncbi:LytR C-terminal domain-containing protein [Lentzea waywayandensis]|uniref:LytR C-terminal domain-containing protein n=1 Tax=Lentzea waywayandensis TaxID=84724 RepID=UPI000A86ABEB|nr:LytR C-terminal domain-containing protein [Lentzea waywayandensis]